MLIKIRSRVFETNSSSVHTMTIMSEEELNQWKKGELFNSWGTLVKKEDLPDYDKEDEDEVWDFEQGYQTFEDFMDDECLEIDYEEYTTKSGEKLFIYCKHGDDNC